MKQEFPKVILGQEAITPDGLGRVMGCVNKFPHQTITVKAYIDDVTTIYAFHNVELIDPRGAVEALQAAKDKEIKRLKDRLGDIASVSDDEEYIGECWMLIDMAKQALKDGA